MKPHEKCQTKYCRNKKAKKKNHCHKCIRRKWKEKNPISYLYFTLKENAKRRGKFFDLTREQFNTFVIQNPDYLKFRGKTKLSMSVDRDKIHLGYTASNIKSITLSDNSKKRWTTDYKTSGDVPF